MSNLLPTKPPFLFLEGFSADSSCCVVHFAVPQLHRFAVQCGEGDTDKPTTHPPFGSEPYDILSLVITYVDDSLGPSCRWTDDSRRKHCHEVSNMPITLGPSSLSRTSNCKSGSFLKACLESWTQLVVHHDSVHRSRWITLLDNHNGYPGCLVFTFSLLFDSIVVWETMVSLYSKNIGKTLCYVKPVLALNPWSEKSNWHGL